MIGEGDLVGFWGFQVSLDSTAQRTECDADIISPVVWFARLADGKMVDLWTGSKSSR